MHVPRPVQIPSRKCLPSCVHWLKLKQAVLNLLVNNKKMVCPTGKRSRQAARLTGPCEPNPLEGGAGPLPLPEGCVLMDAIVAVASSSLSRSFSRCSSCRASAVEE